MASSSSCLESRWEIHARTTLEQLKTEFFLSLRDETGDLLSSFQSSWEAFRDTLQSIHSQLQAETLDSIAEFTSLMTVVSCSMLECDSPGIVDQFKADLIDEFRSSKEQESTVSVAPPRYIAPCIRWLRANIHDPYPSRAVRSAIARDTRSAVKDIDAWFIDARKRIGWSGMRYTRFGNRKADIIDAAARFFNNSDPLRPLNKIVESEFAAILSTVEELYQEKCARSALASHLDNAVKDLTPDLRMSLSSHKQQALCESRHSKTPRRRHGPYPTPEHSPALSSRSLETPKPPHLRLSAASCMKRSRSSSIGCPTDTEEDHIRPTKRTRHTSIPTLRTPPTSCYPSPAASVVIDLTEHPAEGLVSAEVDTSKHTGKRKRTMSDSGIVRPAPPRDSLSQPRASLDPPPLSASEILDQATFCPPSPSAAPEATSSAFVPFDPFFTVFMNGGAPTLGDTSPLPLLNIVDDVAPTNVHVEFDQSWLSSSALAPSYDPYGTGYNTNFDDFGGNPYGGSVDPFNTSLWYGDPPSQSLVSAPCPGGSTLTLTGQLNVSPPSEFDLQNVAPPSSSQSDCTPHNRADKARELLELEARCATLRSELAAGGSMVSILP